MEFNCKKLKRNKGNINIMFSYMLLIITVLLIAYSIANNQISILSNRIEDALDASTLAAATVDVRKYALDGSIVNIDPQGVTKSYNAFVSTLKNNLSLNDDFSLQKESFISGKVQIEDFIVYSLLSSEYVGVSKVINGSVSYGKVGWFETPNGKDIEDTMVYAKLKFKLVVMGKEYTVWKESVVKVTER